MQRRARRLPMLLALTAGLSCATPEGRPVQMETREDHGFRIEEEVRAGLGARSDFEEAVERLIAEDYEGGIAKLLEVTEAAPQATAAHIDLGMAYARTDQLEKAEESLRRALELNPRHPVARNELGMVLRRTGRFDEARRSYEETLADHPDFHFARRNLAILCDVFLGDLECALEHYEAYRRAVPEDEAVTMWIADLRSRAGR